MRTVVSISIEFELAAKLSADALAKGVKASGLAASILEAHYNPAPEKTLEQYTTAELAASLCELSSKSNMIKLILSKREKSEKKK